MTPEKQNLISIWTSEVEVSSHEDSASVSFVVQSLFNEVVAIYKQRNKALINRIGRSVQVRQKAAAIYSCIDLKLG